MTAFMLLALLGVSLTCAFLGVRLKTWTIAVAATIAVFALTGSVGWLAVALTTLVAAAVLVPLNVRQIRQTYISAPFLKEYRQMLPGISETEAAAIEAGTVGWEGELFAGRPDWKRLLGEHWPELTTEEQAFIDGPVEEFCGMLNHWEIYHEDADLPPEAWAFLKKHRFFAMIIPKEFGGLGFSAVGQRAVHQKLASVSAVAATTVSVPNSLGPAELLLKYGTDEQQNFWLPRLASGDEIPCFGLTGPTAGSDATSIPDFGIVCRGQYRGEDVLGLKLTFDKRYITLAPVATVIGLAFRMYDPEGLLGGDEDRGITVALVPRDTEGMEIGARHMPLDIPFQNGPIRGEEVFVPLDAIIGGPEMAGKGWRMLVDCLSVGRAITLPSSSTGGAKMCALATGAYARIRRQFNMPIGRFEGVEEALARIGGHAYAIGALSRMTAAAVDRGEKPAVPSAIAKYHATEMARVVVNDAMDIHGGKGIILGPKNYLGRGYQGSPIWITVEGANIMTRNLMIFGQGAIRCHPFVLKEMEAAKISDNREAVRVFDDLLFQHIGYSVRNAVRSFFLGLSMGRFAAVPNDRRTGKYYRKLSRYSAALAIASDVAMLTLGGKLKQKERLSARLGDVLSQLYICSSIMRRYEAQGRPAADQAVLAWAYHDAVYKMQVALAGVVDNFPNRAMRVLLSVVIFPLGRRERAPGDRLSHRVAQLLINPSETRDRLTDGVYRSAATGHPVGVMEEALPLVIAAEPLERKLLKAQRAGQLDHLTWEGRLEQALDKGIVDQGEYDRLLNVRDLMMEIISVDEFSHEELTAGSAHRSDDGTSKPADNVHDFHAA